MTENPTSGIPTVTVDEVPAPVPEGVSIIDVRVQAEWDAGHIEGATHLPLEQLPQRLDELPEGQSLVVCKVGGRSSQAVGYLMGQGYDVVNLDGGMLDWQAAGRPMVSETGDDPTVI